MNHLHALLSHWQPDLSEHVGEERCVFPSRNTAAGKGLKSVSGGAGPRSWLGLFQSLDEHLVAQSTHEHRLPLSLRGWKGKQVSEALPFPTTG